MGRVKKSVAVSEVPGEGRARALEAVMAQIDKNYGAGAVMRMGDRKHRVAEAISTSSIALDAALGIGGVPKGRVVEVYGPESSGKTTLALHMVANVQKAGGVAAFIDAEHALDPLYAARIGVDLDELLVSQPDTGEQALDIMDMLVGSGAVDIIVVDSVAALVPRAEIEGDMGDSHVGLQARLMSQALRKITGRLAATNTTAIFINQLREKIGVFFGSPETTTGGKALKFYASVRVDIRRTGPIKNAAGETIGNRTRQSPRTRQLHRHPRTNRHHHHPRNRQQNRRRNLPRSTLHRIRQQTRRTHHQIHPGRQPRTGRTHHQHQESISNRRRILTQTTPHSE